MNKFCKMRYGCAHTVVSTDIRCGLYVRISPISYGIGIGYRMTDISRMDTVRQTVELHDSRIYRQFTTDDNDSRIQFAIRLRACRAPCQTWRIDDAYDQITAYGISYGYLYSKYTASDSFHGVAASLSAYGSAAALPRMDRSTAPQINTAIVQITSDTGWYGTVRLRLTVGRIRYGHTVRYGSVQLTSVTVQHGPVYGRSVGQLGQHSTVRSVTRIYKFIYK